MLSKVAVGPDGRPSGPVASIPTSGSYSGPFYACPDGRRVALVDNTEAGDTVNILDVATGQITNLFRDRLWAPDMFLNWHPNCRHVLWRAIQNYPDTGLWLVDSDSGDHYIVVSNPFAHPIGEITGGAVSPDGQRVVYALQKDIFSSGQVWMVDAYGNNPRSLFSGGGAMFAFAWSPDGTKVAYVGCDSEGTESEGKQRGTWAGICVMDANGQNRRELGSNFNAGYGFLPVWSPDSQTIAFVARELPEEKPDPNNPPDWDEWAFRGANVHLVDVNTGEERRLLPDGVEGNIDPVWSPDGSMIAFASTRSGTAEIWVVNADGTGLRQLSHDGQLTRYPIWLRR